MKKNERLTPFVDIPVHKQTRDKIRQVKKLKNSKSFDALMDDTFQSILDDLRRYG